MNKRKTFEIDDLKQMVNSRLKESTCSPDERFAMASILEDVLHRTGNYRGFTYLTPYPQDELARADFDDSRRFYF